MQHTKLVVDPFHSTPSPTLPNKNFFQQFYYFSPFFSFLCKFYEIFSIIHNFCIPSPGGRGGQRTDQEDTFVSRAKHITLLARGTEIQNYENSKGRGWRGWWQAFVSPTKIFVLINLYKVIRFKSWKIYFPFSFCTSLTHQALPKTASSNSSIKTCKKFSW